MEYKKLDVKEKTAVVNDFLRAQEMDHYCHTLNAGRYRKILEDPELPDGEFKEKIQKLLSDTEARLAEVGLIIRHSQ